MSPSEFSADHEWVREFSEHGEALAEGRDPRLHAEIASRVFRSAVRRKAPESPDFRDWLGTGAGSGAAEESLRSVLSRCGPTSRLEAPEEVVGAMSRTLVDCAEAGLDPRVGRLLVAWIALVTGYAPTLFRLDERGSLNRWQRADRSPVAECERRLGLAGKLREGVCDPRGRIHLLVSGDSLSGVYRGPDGESLIVEWHSLARAEENWKAGRLN